MEEKALEVYDVIRTIRDPEKPNTLEELDVVSEKCVEVQDLGDEEYLIIIKFSPTVPHCSLATLIDEPTSAATIVSIDIRAVGFVYKSNYNDVCHLNTSWKFTFLKALTPQRKILINRSMTRRGVAAAMENPNLREIVEQCVTEPDD